jgi:uncharacterized protein (TIGR04141 family)
MKLRTHPFSIYLLKKGVEPLDALSDEHELEPAKANNLPHDSELYLLEGEAYLWWAIYLGLEKKVRKNRVGAVLFVRSKGRWFVITFGQVRHLLDDEKYEHEFGLRVTLNSIDPDKLRGTDTYTPGVGRLQRVHLPIATDLTVLDFDQNSQIMRNIAGKVRDDLKALFSGISGSDAVQVRSNIQAPKLGDLCANLLMLSEREDYKTAFPQIGRIARTTDPVIVRRLNKQLVKAVQGRSPYLNLTVPELVDAGYVAHFVGAGHRGGKFHDIYIQPYFDYIEHLDDDDITLDALKKSHRLVVAGNYPKFPLFKCLLFDTALPGDGALYHLFGGQWYRVEKDYVDELTKALDPLWEAGVLPDFHQKTEGQFNFDVAQANAKYACLDTSSLSPVKKHRVEPCDLLTTHGHRLRFWHVKRSTLSFALSHLFNQGTNAIHLLKQEPKARENLRKLVLRRCTKAAAERILPCIDGNLYDVIFAIITHKPEDAKSANLPLFSKISLLRSAKELGAYGVRTRFQFVRDVSEKTAKKLKAKELAKPAPSK